MLLFSTSIDNKGQFRDLFAVVDSLEKAFDFLNLIVSADSHIIKAEVEDTGTRIMLPPEAFDGHLVSPIIEELQGEWQQILGTPV